MPFDFPNSPTNGQTITGANGVVYRWDGTKWAATGAAGGASISVSDTPPASPSPGALWWDSVGGQLYLYYQDPNTTAWVPASNMQGLANAATKADVATALNNVGRNLVHNSLFNIWQRGTAAVSVTGAYTADRWRTVKQNDTISYTQVALVDADRTAIGDGSALFALQNSFTGNATSGSNNYILQPIEGIRRIYLSTVAVSFWAKATSGTPRMGVNIYYHPGTGGSPSGPAWSSGPQVVTLSTTWTRYTVGIQSQRVALTLGTNGDDYSGLAFFFSGASATNSYTGVIGVQTNTVQLWGVQLEIGTTATPLEKPDPQQDIAKCQRFFFTNSTMASGYNQSGLNTYVRMPLPTTMRAIPTVAASGVTANNCTLSVIGSTPSDYQATLTATATTFTYANYTITASADL